MKCSKIKKKNKSLLDHNIPSKLKGLLLDRGHNVRTVDEYGYSTRNDSCIYQKSRSESRALLTRDLDFLDDRMYLLKYSCGIFILGSSCDEAFVNAVYLLEFGISWIGTKLIITSNMVTCRYIENGCLHELKYEFRKNGKLCTYSMKDLYIDSSRWEVR